MNEPKSPARVPFYEETQQQSLKFAAELLALVPELDGIAIIPSWKVQQDAVSYGVVVGAHGPLTSPFSLSIMIQQLMAVIRSQMRVMEQTLLVYDKEAKRLTDELRSAKQILTEGPPGTDGL